MRPDLLDLSRLRSGKLKLNREIVSMVVAVNKAIDTVQSDAEAKKIAIEFIQPDESLFVEGDPVRLEQIVWNLLNKSVKFFGERQQHLSSARQGNANEF